MNETTEQLLTSQIEQASTNANAGKRKGSVSGMSGGVSTRKGEKKKARGPKEGSRTEH